MKSDLYGIDLFFYLQVLNFLCYLLVCEFRIDDRYYCYVEFAAQNVWK